MVCITKQPEVKTHLYCDFCGQQFFHPIRHEEFEGIIVFTMIGYILLCEDCYKTQTGIV